MGSTPSITGPSTPSPGPPTRIIRVCESLEKHSGVSCWFNIAHSLQRYFPFARMPHHHDWHHEGHKGCNYTFSSIGGLWDCLFGTRRVGRAETAQLEHDAPLSGAVVAGQSAGQKSDGW